MPTLSKRKTQFSPRQRKGVIVNCIQTNYSKGMDTSKQKVVTDTPTSLLRQNRNTTKECAKYG